MPANFTQLAMLLPQAVSTLPAYRIEVAGKQAEAFQALQDAQANQQRLIEIVDHTVTRVDRLLRCAGPTQEPILAQYPPGTIPDQTILLASDGSQVMPDLHSGCPYGLTNTAVVRMQVKPETTEPPSVRVETGLFLENMLITEAGTRFDLGSIDLLRDTQERTLLAESALQQKAKGSVLSLIEGQGELWGARTPTLSRGLWMNSLNACVGAFRSMVENGLGYVGYVESQTSELLTRLAEIASADSGRRSSIRQEHPFAGATDAQIFRGLKSGYRSATFELKTRATGALKNDLRIHFCFLNVGYEDRPHVVRLEFPAWLHAQPGLLDQFHAVILDQCRIVPGQTYPLILTLAHKACCISFAESALIQRKIHQAYLDHGLEINSDTPKSVGKELVK